jgi:hypothetical protein
MKSSNLLVLGLAVCLVSAISSAANPANWTFSNVTVSNGGSTNWTSSTAVDNTFNHYDFMYNITRVDMEVEVFSIKMWQDVTSYIDPSYLSGSGGEDGTLPLVISNQHVAQSGTDPFPYNIVADLNMSVDASGYGHFDITNVTLEVNGSPTRMRFTGTMDVTGSQVPEPCTLAVLGCAAAGLIARRRNRK